MEVPWDDMCQPIPCCYGYQIFMVNKRYLNNAFVLSLFYIWYRASETNKLLWLLRFHSGYHGDQVTIATRFVAHAYCFTEPGYQI